MGGHETWSWLVGCIQRVAVNSSMAKWRSVITPVSQRSTLGLLLFNIFISDMDSGIGCTLSKFVGDSKMSGAANMPEGREFIQRDLGRLERWACEPHEVR